METSSHQLTCGNNKYAVGMCHDFIASTEQNIKGEERNVHIYIVLIILSSHSCPFYIIISQESCVYICS